MGPQTSLRTPPISKYLSYDRYYTMRFEGILTRRAEKWHVLLYEENKTGGVLRTPPVFPLSVGDPTSTGYRFAINIATNKTTFSLSFGLLSAMRSVSAVSAVGVSRFVSNTRAFRKNHTNAYAPERLLPSTNG